MSKFLGGLYVKKWLLVLVMILTVGLAACGEDTSAPADEAEAEPEEEKQEELTADEVYEKSLEAAEGMESAEIAMDMTQSIEIPDQEVTMDTQSVTEAEIIMDPLAMYQTGTVTVEADGQTQESETELYLAENEMYMFDSVSQTWMKMDSSMIPMDQIQQQDPADQLKMMEQFVDKMEMEENDEEYILKITGDGEELKTLTQELMEEYMDSEMMATLEQEGIDIFEAMSINNVYYEVLIDKETFETTTFNMDMDMSIDAEDEQMNLTQSVASEYKGINTVDSIEVPQEVKDEAVDIMEEMENMEDMEAVQ